MKKKKLTSNEKRKEFIKEMQKLKRGRLKLFYSKNRNEK